MLTRFIALVRGMLRRGEVARQVDEEMAFHVEQEVAARVASGMSPADARRTVLRDLRVPQTTDAVRAVRTAWFDTLWRDVWCGARSLTGTPAFTALALIVIMLGVGASTAIYSLVDAVVLRSLPFVAPDRLVAVSELSKWDSQHTAASPPNFLDWRARQDVFDGLAAVASGSVTLTRQDGYPPEVIQGRRVTAELFSVLGVSPLIGRTFSQDDESKGRTDLAVISYGLWHRRFGGVADVLGRRLADDQGEHLEVVGVMPPGFDYLPGSRDPAEIWWPYIVPVEQRLRGTNRYAGPALVARLRVGVTLDEAQTRLDQITAGMRAEHPGWFEPIAGVRVEPLHRRLTGGVQKWMFLLLGAAVLVLVLACVNVAGLLLVRATARTRELGIRAALGATRWQIARGLLVESLLLSVAGALLGMSAAYLAVGSLREALPADVPRAASVGINLRVCMATAVASIVTGVAFGLAPALLCSRPRLNDGLKDAGRTATTGSAGQWLRSGLVTAEIALATVLLVASALFGASFARVSAVGLGMNVDRVLTVQVAPPEGTTHVLERALAVVDSVRRIQGIDVASAAGVAVPMAGGTVHTLFKVPGRSIQDGRPEIAVRREVSPDYFRALGIPLLLGRSFSADDRRDGPSVAVLNESAARHFFGTMAAAVGQTIEVDRTRRQVVGVVGDTRQDGPESKFDRAFFIPLAQADLSMATLVLRTSGDPSALLASVRQVVWSEFPDALVRADTIQEFLDGRLAPRRLNMLLLGLFGVVGLVIAGLGVYGVMAFVVAQRTREIGIRMALGASRAGVLALVLGRASFVVGIGLVIGLVAAWGSAGVAKDFLFEIQPRDVRVYLGAGFIVLLIGYTAAWVPARRAARVDPVVALRAE